MMANWDLAPLWRALTDINVPMHFVVGSNDKTVPPTQSKTACSRMVTAELHSLEGLGHLAHEEAPAQVVGLLEKLLLNDDLRLGDHREEAR